MSDDVFEPEDGDVTIERSDIDERALVLSDEPIVIPNDLMFLGKAMAGSQFFRDARPRPS